MALTTEQIVRSLEEIGTLKRLSGENEFKAIAYDRAARTIGAFGEDINVWIEEKKLKSIKGIGDAIARHIYELNETGNIEELDALRNKVPKELVKWLDISGLGPKKVYRIHKELDITTISDLKMKCEDGSVAAIEGLGAKSAEKILKSIEWMESHSDRCRLDEAMAVAGPMLDFLQKQKGVNEISLAGSLRRHQETIGDVDILISCSKEFTKPIFDAFTGHDLVTEVLGRGETKSSVRTETGRQVDLRIVSPEAYPAALMYFTGSKEHNVVLRQRARDRNMTLNEYGLLKLNRQGEADPDRPVPANSEEEIYRKLDLAFIPPELREDLGEFEYFEKHKKLQLLEEADIRGVLHAHSTWSDGKYSIREMADACMERGYKYLGLTDHSRTAAYAGGLSIEDVKRQWDEIEQLNEEYGNKFRIFKGIESDILDNGDLDYPDAILEQFDFVIASLHARLNMPRVEMMKRVKKAIEHPCTSILGHATGRLLLKRDGADLDMNEILTYARRHNVAVEINANPMRLDMDWRLGKKARELGLISAICPDAHTKDGIDDIRYGVWIARKAWFGPERILNTMDADGLVERFKERKK